MQRLLANTNQIAPHSGVNDPLLCDHGQVPVHLKYSSTWGHHYGLLPGPVQVAVDEMFFKSIQRDVQNLKKVSLSSRRVCSSWDCEALSVVIFQHQLLVVSEGLSEKSKSGKPVLKLFILNHNSIEVFIEPGADKI